MRKYGAGPTVTDLPLGGVFKPQYEHVPLPSLVVSVP